MNREEVEEELLGMIQYDDFHDLLSLADKIFNDFESRTCENCKYDKDNIMTCEQGIDRPYCYKGIRFPNKIEPFGCNKFERIEHERN